MFQTILLCAGQSSRMWPLGDKIFFEYLGKSLFEHQVERLLKTSFGQKIHIVGNEKNFSLLQETAFSAFPSQKERFSFSLQKDVSEGMLGGVLAAKSNVQKDVPLFIMSSNDFVEKSYFQFLQDTVVSSSSDIFICGKKVETYFPGGYLVLNSKNHVKKIEEKPRPEKVPSKYINLVLHVFKDPQNLFLYLEKERKKRSHYGYESALQKLFDDGVVAEAVFYKGAWTTLKYPWHHFDMMETFWKTLKNPLIHPSSQVSKKASVAGNVVLSEGVKVFDFAVITGPCFIGKDTIVGTHALVRESHIGEKCVIGHGTEVARSYLRSHVCLHQNYVGDSVLDEGVCFGAGTRTGNFRLDKKNISIQVRNEIIPTSRNKVGVFCGKNVSVGINSSFMPGVKVGNNSFLAAGAAFSEDIPEGVFLKGLSSFSVKKNNFFPQ